MMKKMIAGLDWRVLTMNIVEHARLSQVTICNCGIRRVYFN
jgi:hypothetical protein